MKKIVRLTESDLVKIVKRVINETNDSRNEMSKEFGVVFDGVTIIPEKGTGHLIFKSINDKKEFKVTVNTMFYDGNVAVTKIFKSGDGLKITDNTGKSFSVEKTNILDLVKQFKLRKPKLTASNSVVDLSLIRV